MNVPITGTPAAAEAAPPIASIGIFERYLTIWVLACIAAGTLLGHLFPGTFATLGGAEVARVNLPVAVLIWLMIVPMLLKIDFSALAGVRQHWKGIGVTLFVNWAVKPFSMALLGWIFICHVFAAHLPAAQLDSYIAGLILLAAAPCTAMVFVWSNLCNGEPHFTLSQVALNDAIMVFAFAPIVALLLGISSISVPWNTLLLSVLLYIVVPVIFSLWLRRWLLSRGGALRLHAVLKRLGPVSLVALLATLAVVRLPGQADRGPARRNRHTRGADPDPGLLQFRSGLFTQPQAGRAVLCCRTFRADRSQQLL